MGNTKTITNCSGDVKWSMVNPGKYWFKMTILYPHRDSKTYTMSGNYAYNGDHT